MIFRPVLAVIIFIVSTVKGDIIGAVISIMA